MSFILKISFRLLLKIIIKNKNNSQNVREGGWVFREEKKFCHAQHLFEHVTVTLQFPRLILQHQFLPLYVVQLLSLSSKLVSKKNIFFFITFY